MIRIRVALTAAALLALAACGGGSGGPGLPAAPGPAATSSASTGGATSASGATPASTGATSTPTTSGAATTTPGVAATPTSSGGTTTAPTRTPTPTGTTVPQSSVPAPTAPPDAAGHTNVVPAIPAAGQCRAGTTYDVYVQSGPTVIAPTGSQEVFTVFEPDTLCGGTTYPIVFNGPGFGGSRTSAAGSFEQFTGHGYGAISVDEAGEGNDGGKIRVMDPDQEGQMLLAVLNWAQAKLAWVAYGPTNDGSDPHEPIYGTEGGSYGGMYQFMLLNIDTRHRIRAMVPQITPSNLNFSLFPGGAIKTLWDSELFGTGQTAGNGTQRAQFDPYVNNGFTNDFQTDAEDPGFHDFFGYHSADYFCNGQAIATNGGSGTAPMYPPTTKPPMVNAMVWIGVRDTLFDFNNGYANYQCLQRGGGDVRLLSYQAGHNSLGTVPDPYVSIFYPANDQNDIRCGNTVTESSAEVAWFDRYLKGVTGAISGIPTNPCISLAANDGVTVPQIATYANGGARTSYVIPLQTIVAGGSPDLAPTAFDIGSPAGPRGDVVAGVPHIIVDVSNAVAIAANTGTPTIYVGLGVKHASNPSIYDLVDNQIMPLRGLGHFDEDLIGGGVRLLPGDQLAVLIYGNENQFAATGSINAAKPAVLPVTISGLIYVPDLGAVPANI